MVAKNADSLLGVIEVGLKITAKIIKLLLNTAANLEYCVSPGCLVSKKIW